MKFFPVALLSLLSIAGASAQVEMAQTANFLFIGNSYTGTNELEVVFDSIIEDGIPEWKGKVYSRAAQQGGRTLARHYEEADGVYGENPLRQMLVTDPIPWNWVTLQDQSQVPAFYEWDYEGTQFWRSTEGSMKLNDMIAATGAQTMFFMTWGRRDGDSSNADLFPDFLTMQDKLEEGYRRFQDATSTLVRPTFMAPVGLVFKSIYLDELNAGIDPTGQDTLFRSLYAGDGSHPSVSGTYVAALTLYVSMTGKSPTAINWWPGQMTETTARTLQYAVGTTILETFNSGDLTYPWTVAFAAGTPPPRTSSPTTVTPTPNPTSLRPTTPPPSPDPTPRPTAATTPRPTAATTPRPTPVQTPRPTSVQTPRPTPRPTPKPTPTPTQMPTLRPTPQPRPTPSPTKVPTAPLPTAPPGKGSLTIRVEYDQYPEEISWTLVRQYHEEEPLFFQSYESGMRPNSLDVHTFSDLEPGSFYYFRISDSESDGLCCDNGWGSFKIYDNVKGVELYDVQADFKSYFEIKFKIQPDGEATPLNRATHYTPGTWTELEAMIAPNDSDWPGIPPTKPAYSIMINLKVDTRPRQLSWTLYRDDFRLGWVPVQTWDGFDATSRSLVSTEISGLEHAWYKLVVQDSGGNGICCDFGRGFISVMGPLSSGMGKMGLVWGNNGQFQDEEEVLFLMGSGGNVQRVRWEEDEW